MNDVRQGRWKIALLLGAGVLVNYFDRVNLSVSRDALGTSFGISDVTFGYLSAAYNWTYALCQLPAGLMLDRFGVQLIGRVSILLWSVASFAAAGAAGVRSFLLARLLLGVGEAPTFPANAKAIGLWFPASERGLATSIFDSAAKLASAIGVPVIGTLVLLLGWRKSFAVTGILSLLYFIVFCLSYNDPSDRKASGNHSEMQSAPNTPIHSLGYLLTNRKVLGLAIGMGSYNYIFYLLLTWLPTYLTYTLHVNLLHSFLYTGVPWLFAAVTDLLVGGLLVDKLIKLGFDAQRVRRVTLIGGMCCGLAILGAMHPSSLTASLIWISIASSGMAAAAPVAWSLPSILVKARDAGKVGGIANFSNQVSGITAPIVTGYAVSRHHSFALAFAIAAVYLLVGILAYMFLLGRLEPIDESVAF